VEDKLDGESRQRIFRSSFHRSHNDLNFCLAHLRFVAELLRLACLEDIPGLPFTLPSGALLTVFEVPLSPSDMYCLLQFAV
jgi:hypothetical protein